MSDVKLKLNIARIRAVIPDAIDEALGMTAAEIEGHAKARISANGQIDTGFMMSAVQHDSKHFGPVHGATVSPDLQRVAAPLPALGDASAIVHAAAEYSIYQEEQQSFLYAGAQDAVGGVGGNVSTVFEKLVV
jgi:hypothetical protein